MWRIYDSACKLKSAIFAVIPRDKNAKSAEKKVSEYTFRTNS